MVSRRGLVVGSSVVLAAAGASRAAAAAPSDVAAIVQRRALRIAIPDFPSPPFFDGAESALSGIDPGLGREIALGLGVEAQFVRSPKTFNEAVDAVERGEADLAVCKLSRTLRRASAIVYSRPYVRLNHGLLVNRVRFAAMAGGREAPDVIRGFRGKVGVLANSSFAEFAPRNFPHAGLVTFQTWPSMIEALGRGEIDAAYRDEFEIKKLLVEHPSLSLLARSITLTDQTDTIAIGVRADATHLRSFVDLFLELAGYAQPRTADEILASLSPRQGSRS